MYSRALDVISKKNYDYGVSLLKDLVKAVPGFWDARELLRSAEIKKSLRLTGFQKITGQAKAKLSIFKGKMTLSKDPREALNLAEEALASFYSNEGLHFLYEVAVALDTSYIAIDALERFLESDPNNEKVIEELIALQEVEGNANRVLQLRQKIVSMRPNDLKAQANLRAAAATATMAQNAASAAAAEKSKVATKNNGTNLPDMSDLERGDRIIRSEEDIKEMIRRYEQIVDAGQGTIEVYRKLGDFYQRVNMHEKAIDAFNKLAQKQGLLDLVVDKAIERSNVALAEEHIEEMIATSNPTPEEVNEARKSVTDYQIQCGLVRVKNYPNDLQVRYDLALLYFELEMIDRALEEFQHAKLNPQRKLASMIYIGRCFAIKEQYDMAIDMFEEALKEMPYMDVQKMRAIYYLGAAYERMGKDDKAFECFKQIYAANVNYMDVAEKVKKHYDRLRKKEEPAVVETAAASLQAISTHEAVDIEGDGNNTPEFDDAFAPTEEEIAAAGNEEQPRS